MHPYDSEQHIITVPVSENYQHYFIYAQENKTNNVVYQKALQ